MITFTIGLAAIIVVGVTAVAAYDVLAKKYGWPR